MNSATETYRARLMELKAEGRLRSLPAGGDFRYDLSDNDYLGFGRRDDLRRDFMARCDAPLTAAASRLLASRQQEALELENTLAEAYGRPVLLFNSGYHANTGCVAALADARTLIVADKLVHASIIDGIRLSSARFVRFRHNDVHGLERILENEADGVEKVLIITESVFSMDGDMAPLREIAELKERYPDALLYVDEAHAFGLFGERGLGLVRELGLDDAVDVLVGTFGKGAASAGAFVAASVPVKDYLLNTARSFIFSTALPPLCHAWTLRMLQEIFAVDDLRAHLREISGRFRRGLEAITGQENPSRSQIVPWIVGSSQRAVALSERLREMGVNALPIRRPTVPAGTERIRFSLNAALTVQDIDKILKVIATL